MGNHCHPSPSLPTTHHLLLFLPTVYRLFLVWGYVEHHEKARKLCCARLPAGKCLREMTEYAESHAMAQGKVGRAASAIFMFWEEAGWLSYTWHTTIVAGLGRSLGAACSQPGCPGWAEGQQLAREGASHTEAGAERMLPSLHTETRSWEGIPTTHPPSTTSCSFLSETTDTTRHFSSFPPGQTNPKLKPVQRESSLLFVTARQASLSGCR